MPLLNGTPTTTEAISTLISWLMSPAMFDHHHYNGTSVTSHPDYKRSPMMVNGMQFVPTWFRRMLHVNTIGSMSILEGAWTQVRASLDPNIRSGMQIGPRYWTFGEAMAVGKIVERTSHHWPFLREQSRSYWEQSMNVFVVLGEGNRVGSIPDKAPRSMVCTIAINVLRERAGRFVCPFLLRFYRTPNYSCSTKTWSMAGKL